MDCFDKISGSNFLKFFFTRYQNQWGDFLDENILKKIDQKCQFWHSFASYCRAENLLKLGVAFSINSKIFCVSQIK